MDNSNIIKSILNPICLHCNALCHVCRGLTVKDWIKAKNCREWDFSYAEREIGDKLDLKDYITGYDLSPQSLASMKEDAKEDNEDMWSLKGLFEL